MLARDQVDELMCLLATWDRQMLTAQFAAFNSRFPVDFSTEYLSALPEDTLRHIFLALCMQNQRMPEASPPLLAA